MVFTRKNLFGLLPLFLKKGVRAALYFHILFFIFIGGAGIYLRWYNPPTTTLMLYRKYIFDFPLLPVLYTPVATIPKDFKKMVIATEDYRFYRHWGIDLQAIKRAYVINAKVGYRMYGGSTISQQFSRSLFLVPKKVLARKYLEMLIAMELELILPKDRILELYLNYCEWGRGIFGIGQAAMHYFNKEPGALTIDESTRLITILASPILHGPYDFEKRNFLSYRYYFIKFRYYTYRKFQEIALRE